DAGLDVFSWPESVWLSLVLFVIAVGLQFTGPGFISLDFKRSWARRPLGASWIFVLIGVAILAALWFFGAGVNPLS
ncbi:MAG: DoxX family protein, partial [Corynebacterium sp.]|nr:DoxX family protein [Corynebacterium sp.]